MTENSIFWTTDGTGDGGASGYTSGELAAAFRAMTQTDNLGAVWPDYLDELEVTGSTSPVAVGTGGALVYGYPYDNNASVNVVIPTPATLTRIDRIVLRADHTAQTVRITRIAGTEGGSAPAITQTAGTTWDIPLAQVSITIAGAITVTDEREYMSIVGDLGVTAAKLAADAVTTAKVADGAITQAKLGTDTLQKIWIPIAFGPAVTIAASTTDDIGPSNTEVYVQIDKDKLPAGCTVKFEAAYTCPSGIPLDLQLTNAVASSTYVTAAMSGGLVGNQGLNKSGDIYSSLGAGDVTYRVRARNQGGSESTLHNVVLVVEW